MINSTKSYLYLESMIANNEIVNKMLELITKQKEIVDSSFGNWIKLNEISEDSFIEISSCLNALASDLQATRFALIKTPFYDDELINKLTLKSNGTFSLFELILTDKNITQNNLTKNFEKLNDDIIDTVYYYILFNHSVSKTSDRLFTHRNTINYRINKFIQMTNIDIRDLNNSMTMFYIFSLIRLAKGGKKDD